MSDADSEIVVIRTFADAISAHIAQAALDANDIQSIVVGDDAGGAYPALSFSNGVRLAVKHSDAMKALRFLDLNP
jgi:putative signal transducing protein